MSITQSLAHGLEFLLLYDIATSLLSVAEISKKLKYSKSKAYRLVRTLTKYDLLRRIMERLGIHWGPMHFD